MTKFLQILELAESISPHTDYPISCSPGLIRLDSTYCTSATIQNAAILTICFWEMPDRTLKTPSPNFADQESYAPQPPPKTMTPLTSLTHDQLRTMAAEEMGLHVHGGCQIGRVINECVLPNFPVSCDAAMTLADALAKEGWRVTLWNACSLWYTCFYNDHLGEERRSDGSPTLALAITVAFLRVKGRVQ